METIDLNFEAAPSICSDLHLNVQELNIEELLAKPTYRRLYNIVISDPNKSEFEYRKNLIKEMYFLLKITPIMKSELQDFYLDRLEQWYNLNDHKKTQLGSGKLKNMAEEFAGPNNPKRSNTIVRPQSGVCWSKSVSPFLRPYTAKRTQHNSSQIQRPDSFNKSRFGKSNANQSTKIDSCEELTLREFAHSIQDEIDISKQFTSQHRTIHPESQPIYEQLFSIIKKVHTGQALKNEYIKADSQNEIMFKRDKQQFQYSDIHSTQKQSLMSRSRSNDETAEPGLDNADQIIQVEQFDRVSEGSNIQDEEDEDKSELEQYATNKRKLFLCDNTHGQNMPRRSIKGYAFAQVQNKNDELLLKKANNKYSHLTSNKFVNYSKDDDELLRGYVNYTRAKSAMKREMSRKSQSKRLLSAKSRPSTSVTRMKQQTSISRAISNDNIKFNEISNIRPQTAKNVPKVSVEKVFDFTGAINSKENAPSTFIKSSKYNQRKELNKLYIRPVEAFKKLNNNTINVAQIKAKRNGLLTKHDNFLSWDRINPIANVHVQNHNEEALEQIEKIKQKLGAAGNKGLSTNSLMKALYIDSYDVVNSCTTIGDENRVIKDVEGFGVAQMKSQTAIELDWTSKNPFFNMLSNGAKKKMKKKHRKLKKKV